MKEYYKILFLAAAILTLACCGDKDGDLSPSGDDIDWYSVQDGSDPAQHLRYELYAEFGTNVLYTDTLGFRTRTSIGGQQVTEYKKVDIAYWITHRSAAIPHFFLSDEYLDNGSMEDIRAGLEFTRDYVLPLIEPKLMPLSFLLCDSIATLSNSDVRGHHTLYSHYSLNTTLIGELPKIAGMTEGAKKLHAGRIAGTVYAWHIVNTYPELFESFGALSEYVASNGTTATYYGSRQGSNSNWASTAIAKDHWQTVGFLRFNTSSLIYLKMITSGTTNYDLSTIDTHLAGYYCPNIEQDLAEFIARYLADDEAGFRAEFEENERIIAKYDKMKELFPAFLAELKK